MLQNLISTCLKTEQHGKLQLVTPKTDMTESRSITFTCLVFVLIYFKFCLILGDATNIFRNVTLLEKSINITIHNFPTIY